MSRIVTGINNEERGAAMVIVALSMFMLMAVATLAVDGGLIQTDRRQAQNAADNASMAAAWAMCEGRDPSAAGFATAAANGFDNDGISNKVTVTDLGDNRARVSITTSRDAEFGKAIGKEKLDVGAQSTAACTSYGGGAGAIPFGAPPSGFAGGLQKENPCGSNSGNCGRLYVKRLDSSGGVGPDTRDNIGYGTDRVLVPWVYGDDYVYCFTSLAVECNVVESNTGIAADHLGHGFLLRFSDTTNATKTFHYKGSEYNADTMDMVMGPNAIVVPLETHGKPADWNEGIHGPWAGADLSNHYWVSGTIAKCDSPRLASIAIVTHDMSYDPATYKPGDPYPADWPSGTKDMKVLGHYYVFIVEPDNAGDFIGNGNLKHASSNVLWVDIENIKCAGSNYAPGPAGTNPQIFDVTLEG